MVDTRVLEARGASCVGSSPAGGTNMDIFGNIFGYSGLEFGHRSLPGWYLYDHDRYLAWEVLGPAANLETWAAWLES